MMVPIGDRFLESRDPDPDSSLMQDLHCNLSDPDIGTHSHLLIIANLITWTISDHGQ